MKKKVAKRKSVKLLFVEQIGDYGCLLELANASSGPTFGQLILSDVAGARKQIKLLLIRRNSRVAAVGEPDQAENPKCLALATLGVDENVAWTFMDSGATPNIISRGLCERLDLHTEPTGTQIKTATRDKSHSLDVVKQLFVESGTSIVGLDSLVV